MTVSLLLAPIVAASPTEHALAASAAPLLLRSLALGVIFSTPVPVLVASLSLQYHALAALPDHLFEPARVLDLSFLCKLKLFLFSDLGHFALLLLYFPRHLADLLRFHLSHLTLLLLTLLLQLVLNPFTSSSCMDNSARSLADVCSPC